MYFTKLSLACHATPSFSFSASSSSRFFPRNIRPSPRQEGRLPPPTQHPKQPYWHLRNADGNLKAGGFCSPACPLTKRWQLLSEFEDYLQKLRQTKQECTDFCKAFAKFLKPEAGFAPRLFSFIRFAQHLITSWLFLFYSQAFFLSIHFDKKAQKKYTPERVYFTKQAVLLIPRRAFLLMLPARVFCGLEPSLKSKAKPRSIKATRRL